ncbi:hypothetical protein J2T13_001265 [Paenibacillus sp. DS2015]
MRKMKVDREVACDASVLEVLGEQESSSYGMTLLMLSRLFSQSSSPQVNLSHFFDNNNNMKRRITMIAKFRKGSYKLSAAAIILVLALSVILLTNRAGTTKIADSNVNANTGPMEEMTSSFKIVRPIDTFKWFNNLDRANDFANFDFKVPDYLPEGYQLRNVELNKLFSSANQADLIDIVTITFVSNFGTKDEKNMYLIASKGKGTMLKHNLLWGAPYSQQAGLAPSTQQDMVTMGNIKGTLFTKTQGNKNKQEIAKSFLWQDRDVSYAINYHSENNTLQDELPQNRRNITQGELAKVVQSFTFPQQIQHVRYDGEGNSFPLNDQTDLLEAKNILGFTVKLPFDLPDTGLTLIDSTLLKAGDQNTGFSFRQGSDALWNTYHAAYDSQIYGQNDELSLYQSQTPLFDTTRLSLIRKLEMNDIEISAYVDNDHIYFGPLYSGNGLDKTKVKSQTYYSWKQDDIYYAAIFLGMDKNQEENLNSLVLAPLQ